MCADKKPNYKEPDGVLNNLHLARQRFVAEKLTSGSIDQIS